MWCPNGYAAFPEIFRNIRSIVKSTRQHISTDDDWNSFFLPRLSLGDIEAIILHNCIAEFATACPSLSIVSSSGTLFRIDGKILAHRWIENSGWRFSFFDPLVGVVSSKQIDKYFRDARPRLMTLRAAIEEYDSACDDWNSEYYKLCEIEDDFALWQELNCFDGWSLACKQQDVPKSARDFLTLDGRGICGNEEPSTEEIIQSIVDAFDNGVLGNRDDFWRGSCSFLKREAFRAVWSAAAEIRPEISKRGPKLLIY